MVDSSNRGFIRPQFLAPLVTVEKVLEYWSQVGATLVLPQPAPPLSDLHHIDVDYSSRMSRDIQTHTENAFYTLRMSRSPRDVHNYSDDAIQVNRSSRSRHATSGSSGGFPTLVLPHPVQGNREHVEIDLRDIPSTSSSSRRSYPNEDVHNLSQSSFNETPNRRSRSRNPTPTSSNSSRSVLSHLSPGQGQSLRHHIEAGHRTLPSSSRGRRSPASSESSRLSVPNPRSSMSNTSLQASIDV